MIDIPDKVEFDENAAVKTLGLIWNPHSDNFSIKIPSFSDLTVLTKRVVVSEMSQLFDPLGLIGPVVAAAKMFVQTLWLAKLEWDDQLSQEFSTLWQ